MEDESTTLYDTQPRVSGIYLPSLFLSSPRSAPTKGKKLLQKGKERKEEKKEKERKTNSDRPTPICVSLHHTFDPRRHRR